MITIEYVGNLKGVLCHSSPMSISTILLGSMQVRTPKGKCVEWDLPISMKNERVIGGDMADKVEPLPFEFICV
jgi:hypothetical protein